MSTISTTVKINDAFSNPLDRLSSGLQKAQSGMSRLKEAISGGSGGGSIFKSMVGGTVVGGAINKGMELASTGIRSMIGELNEAQTSWTTFEGNMRQIGKSPAEISKAKNELQRFAEQTIYGAADMSSTYSQLAAVGTKNTAQLVKGFGGLAAAAANPAQAMKTLSQQATQMAAKPKVQWEDFKLMVEQTPAGMAAVAKTMGMSLTELISKIQDGQVKTQDFLDAVAKTGTNANFSKMATQYKTIGDAVQGLKEQVTNGLLKTWGKVSQIGIQAVNQLSDALSKVNFEKIGDGLLNGIKEFEPAFEELKTGFDDFKKGFEEFKVPDAIKGTIDSIRNAFENLVNSMDNVNGGKSFFKQLGELSGGTISGLAKAISGIADAISELDPSVLVALGEALLILKNGVKGLMFEAIVWGLKELSKLDPGTIEAVAKALIILGTGLAAFVAFKKVQKQVKGIIDAFKGFKNAKKIKAPEIESPKMTKPGKILSNAGAYLKLGAAFALVGVGALAIGAGFKLLADSATKLSNSGGGAIATFFGMIAAIAGLVILVRFLGPAMIGGAVGFAIFAAGLLLIGIAILIACAGIALLATQLPTISEYGVSAAIGLLALAVALAVFGIAAIIAAVGVILLGVALIVLAIGLIVAGVGAIIFAVGLALVGITALIAAVGVLLLGIAVAVLAVMVIIVAVGMLLLGVALVLVAAMGIVAAVGLLLMGVALMVIMVIAIVSAIGLMLLAVALLLIGPMALIAAIGLLLLGVALIIVAVGLALVAAAAMLVAVALMMVGLAVLMMVTFFIMAGTMMVQAIVNAMKSVINAVKNGINSAVNAVKNFVGNMVSAGKDLIQGLINGIKSMVGSAVNAVKNIGGKIAGTLKGLFKIGSPSRLMKKYGRWIDQGLIIGLNRDSSGVANASESMAQGVMDATAGISPSLDPISLSGTNPGDLLADGFDRALGAISNVAGAITGLDGSRADIGIFGQGAVSSSSVGSDTVTSGSITPNSVLTNNNSNSQTDNSTQVQIDKGAIVINASGNPTDDLDKILDGLEQLIIEKRNKALGGG